MKKLHLIPLIAGTYAALLGVSLMILGITDLGQEAVPNTIGFIRLIIGLAMALLGAWGIWDGIRDLFRPGRKKDETQARQYILTDIYGKRSSNVTIELLREQMDLLSKSQEKTTIGLQVLPQPFIPGVGNLAQVLCACDDPPRLTAFFLSEKQEYVIRHKVTDLAGMEEFLRRFLDGRVTDFSGWEEAEVTVSRAERPAEQCLRIYGENWKDEHKFFSGRDLELAMEGLAEGRYRQVEAEFGSVAVSAFPSQKEEGHIIVYLITGQGNRRRVFEKDETVAQAKFWLVRIYGRGMPEELYGWQDITDRIKI